MTIIKPMLAKAGLLPDNLNEYSFEIKWDGIRALFYLANAQYKLLSRNLKDIAAQYPELTALATNLRHKHNELILDGEIVVFDSDGHPSFSLLQHRMGLKKDSAAKISSELPINYIIFDILSLEHHSLLDNTYLERRSQLENLNLKGEHWQTPNYKIGDGKAFLTASCQLGLEGIIAKRLSSPYQPGKRSGAWLKIKNHQRQELIIGGWVPGQGKRQNQIGALLLGYYDRTPEEAKATGVPQSLLYAGKAGTGFTQNILTALTNILLSLSSKTNPFTTNPIDKNVHYVKPILIGEFEFTEWTPNNTLRHPSFKGMRYDKDPRQVIREKL